MLSKFAFNGSLRLYTEDMNVYCYATKMGLECNAVHPHTDLAFTWLDMVGRFRLTLD